MSSTDDVVIRLRLADVARFVADVKAGKLSIDELEKKIKSVGRTSKAESSEYGGLGLWGATVGRVKYAVAGLALGLGAGAAALASFAVKSTARLEQVRIGFQQLLGSKGAADTMISQLQDFAVKTPFNFQDVTTLTQKLIAFGAPAGQAIGDLTAIGNAVSAFGGSSDDMDGIVTALGQIAMKGHVAGQEILQLNNHMINAKQYLMDALHVNSNQLERMQTSGQLSSSVAIPIILAGMQRQFGGMMDVQSHTLSGMASNLFDSFQQELVRQTNPFLPAMKAWLQDMLDHMPQIGSAIGAVVGGAISWADKAGKFAISVGTKITSGDSFGAGQQVGSLLPNLIKGIMGDGDTYDLGAKVGKASIGFVWGFAEGLFDLSTWWDVLSKHWKGILLTIVVLISGGATGLFGKIGEVLSKIPFIGKFLGGLFKGLDGLGSKLWKPFAKLGKAIFHSIERVYPETATAIRVLFARVGGWFASRPDVVKGWAIGIGRWIMDAIVKAVGTVGGWVVNLLGMTFTGWGLAAASAIGSFAYSMWNGIRSGFLDLINWIIDRWNWLADAIGKHDIPGTSATFGLPHLDHVNAGLAGGGTTTAGGLRWIGEGGVPELLNLPRGSNVIPLPRVAEFAGAGANKRPIHTHVYLDRRQIALAVQAGTDDLAAAL